MVPSGGKYTEFSANKINGLKKKTYIFVKVFLVV